MIYEKVRIDGRGIDCVLKKSVSKHSKTCTIPQHFAKNRIRPALLKTERNKNVCEHKKSPLHLNFVIKMIFN